MKNIVSMNIKRLSTSTCLIIAIVLINPFSLGAMQKHGRAKKRNIEEVEKFDFVLEQQEKKKKQKKCMDVIDIEVIKNHSFYKALQGSITSKTINLIKSFYNNNLYVNYEWDRRQGIDTHYLWVKDRDACAAICLTAKNCGISSNIIIDNGRVSDIINCSMVLAAYHDDIPFITFAANTCGINIDQSDGKETTISNAATLLMLKLLKQYGADLYRTKSPCREYPLFGSSLMDLSCHRDWRIAHYCIDNKIPWQTYFETPLEALISSFDSHFYSNEYRRLLQYEDSEKIALEFDALIKKLYVLSKTYRALKTSYCDTYERERALKKLLSYNQRYYTQRIITILQHLYCWCDSQYREVFEHTNDSPNPQHLAFAWGINKKETDLNIIYNEKYL